MKLIALFFILCNIANGRQLCVSGNAERYSEISLDNLDLIELKTNMEKSPIYILGGALCRVELSIDHQKNLLTIKFTDLLENDILPDQTAQWKTLIERDIGHDDDVRVTDVLSHACSSDLCDEKFILKTIHWFLATNMTTFQEMIMKIIDGNHTEANQCQVGPNPLATAKCPSKRCIGHYSGEENFLFLSCPSDEKSSVAFEITSILKLTTMNMIQSFFIRCNYDACNGFNNMVPLMMEFSSFHDTSELMMILNSGIEPIQESSTVTIENLISSTLSSYKTSETTTTTNKSKQQFGNIYFNIIFGLFLYAMY